MIQELWPCEECALSLRCRGVARGRRPRRQGGSSHQSPRLSAPNICGPGPANASGAPKGSRLKQSGPKELLFLPPPAEGRTAAAPKLSAAGEPCSSQPQWIWPLPRGSSLLRYPRIRHPIQPLHDQELEAHMGTSDSSSAHCLSLSYRIVVRCTTIHSEFYARNFRLSITLILKLCNAITQGEAGDLHAIWGRPESGSPRWPSAAASASTRPATTRRPSVSWPRRRRPASPTSTPPTATRGAAANSCWAGASKPAEVSRVSSSPPSS